MSNLQQRGCEQRNNPPQGPEEKKLKTEKESKGKEKMKREREREKGGGRRETNRCKEAGR